MVYYKVFDEVKDKCDGFIIIILVIDVLFLFYQFQRLVKCVIIGLVCVGGYVYNFFGDLFFVFFIGNEILV